MQIIFDDEKTKYEINLQWNNDGGVPYLIATIIIDNGQEVFKGELERIEK